MENPTNIPTLITLQLNYPIEYLRKDRLHTTRGAFGIRLDMNFLEVEERSVGLLHNFFDIDPFLIIFAPFESSRCQLSNGIKNIKNHQKTDRYRKRYGAIQPTVDRPLENSCLGGHKRPPVLGVIGPYVNPLYDRLSW